MVSGTVTSGVAVVDPWSEKEQRGILAIQHLRFLAERGVLRARGGLEAGQFQPNSVDLRLGSVAYRVRCSFLPGALGVERCLHEIGCHMHALDLSVGAVIEPDVPYLIELEESLDLPADLSARANPKSSTGRLDMFARVVAEEGEAFDEVLPGYRGKLYLHVISRSFPIRLRQGDRLVQLRFSLGDTRLNDEETWELQQRTPILLGTDAPVIEDGLHFSAALRGAPGEVVGYRALAHTPLLDLRGVGCHEVDPFWQPLLSPPGGALVLEPDAFYVLASHERVAVPASVCAEMVPFDAKSAELRTHYAGFFDSGFGLGGGARVVVELRNRDTPFLLQDQQRVFRFQLHRNLAIPEVLYGQQGSHYQGQGLRLAKQFRLHKACAKQGDCKSLVPFRQHSWVPEGEDSS
ncbi:MAG: 2'-deoxycytidine 5'-triphosphate deaminase [Myxococcales bacterium]|nr:2'-deoxycytidine 5'-triphosphate deaminase [Polyangiaceae bacterium]MDW8249506.1 2'-deoxycytidine 5'-triphosphate deaminase [Myxococcales bacterium]